MNNKICILMIFVTFISCNQSGKPTSNDNSKKTSITLSFTRIEESGLDPFYVNIHVTKDGVAQEGQTLSIKVPKGAKSAVEDLKNGDYRFKVTPTSTGEYPISVSLGEVKIERTAIVLDINLSGTGQPIAVPGDFVNSEGYEDGATVTPDGKYLFVQYGPIHFSGLLYYSTICDSDDYSAGYDLNNCSSNTNSELIFDTIGPYTSPKRPDFPEQNILAGKLQHLDDLILSGYFNGIIGFPTQFYGFKRQEDGTYAEPFKLAFNDEKAINSPFGPSFILNDDGTANFIIAWNNYFDGNADGGVSTGEDDKPDIYYGSLTLGQSTSLGDISYSSNDGYSSIVTNLTPIPFSTHSGVQGNPHAFTDNNNKVTSIWVDDEQTTHDLYVYTLSSGSFPNGTWEKKTLPSTISTAAEESQPFFSGQAIFLRRGTHIVSHEYLPLNGDCNSGYTHNDCWGEEKIVIGANGNSGTQEIFSVGEPTIANIDGDSYLYFVYVLKRNNPNVSLNDWNINVGLVKINN